MVNPLVVCLKVRSLEKNECEKMNQNNQKNGVCDLIVEITNSLKLSDLIGYSIYKSGYKCWGNSIDCLGENGVWMKS
jgi:hypothetical protein